MEQDKTVNDTKGASRKVVGIYNIGNIGNLEKIVPIPAKPQGATRFVCLSDTHTKHKELVVPDGDILMHAGDFTYTGAIQEVEEFANWFGSLPHPHKVIIAGNHECTFDLPFYEKNWSTYHYKSGKQNAKKIKAIISESDKWKYLEDGEVTINNFRIWGSPHQPEFCNWAFNVERGKILKKWKLIPKGTDILITHGPPKRHGGMTFDGLDAGCDDLLDEIRTRVKPMVHLFGHIHEAYGVTKDETTVYINGSNCTLKYKPHNVPVVFDVL